jgi:predicted amidohydrolase YtcJ
MIVRAMPNEADLLLVNANVLTVDPARPRAGAVAVRGDRIAGVYDGEPGVRAANVIDLKGATLLPGFHDAHNHMIGFGRARQGLRYLEVLATIVGGEIAYSAQALLTDAIVRV